MRLQTKLIFFICVVLSISLGIVYWFMSNNANVDVREEVGNRAQAISTTVALSPNIIENIEKPEKYLLIQQYAEAIREETGLEFVVVVDSNGIRITHPDHDKIGKHVVGDDALKVFSGDSYISYDKGTLGESLRAFRPVYNKENKIIGAVIVGISTGYIDKAVHERNMNIFYVLMMVFIFGVLAAMFIARGIKNALLGMEPAEIARVTVERNAVIKSVREGIFVVNNEGFLTVVNDEAVHILKKAGIEGDLLGKNIEEYVPYTRMLEVIKTGKPELDREQNLNGVFILTNRLPLVVDKKIVGAIATFRDLEEIRHMAEELTGVKEYVEALRAKTHEFLNKLHVINGLVITKNYDTLAKYVDKLMFDGGHEVVLVEKCIKDPVISSFLQSKLSRSRELNVNLIINPVSSIPLIANIELQNALITILGNLLDNAMEATQFSKNRDVELLMSGDEKLLEFEVKDCGVGIQEENFNVLFKRGYSTKGANRGFGLFLVAKEIEKFNGTVEISENYPCGTIFNICLYPNGREGR